MRMKRRLRALIIAVALSVGIGVSPIINMDVYADNLVYGDFSYLIIDNEIMIMSYNGTATSVNVPEIIDGKNVTQIGAYAFQESDVVNVMLPDSITTIGYNAFANCKKLETINFPDGLKEIGDYAFTNCHSLKEVNLGNNVESIGKYAFQLCISLSEISVPGTVKKIQNHTFHGCRTVEELVFEEGVTSIEAEAALNMYALEKIVIPKSVTEIGEHALGYGYYYPDYTRIGATIYGYEGTAAETYAINNGFDFVNVEAKPEIQKDPVEAFVERMYTVALNREFDEEGRNNWVQELKAGKIDGAGLANKFIMGQEFAMRGLTDDAYVDTLYRTLFNRVADEDGKNIWLANLLAGQTRGYVLSNFVNLPEFTMLCDAYGIECGVMLTDGTAVNPGITKFVKKLYVDVLGRAAENDGLYGHVVALATKATTAEDVTKSFFGSEEYKMQNKSNEAFVRELYVVFMGRTADAGGLAFWVACLEEQGVSREWVISEFAKSAEFKEIAAKYGL